MPAKKPLQPWGPNEPLDHRRLNAMQEEQVTDVTAGAGVNTVKSGNSLSVSARQQVQPLTSVMVWVETTLVYRLDDGGNTATDNWDDTQADDALRGTDSDGPGKYFGYILTGRAKDDPRRPIGYPDTAGGSAENYHRKTFFPDGLLKGLEQGLYIPCVVMNAREFKIAGDGLLTPTPNGRPADDHTQYQTYQGTVIGMTPDDPDVPLTGANSIPAILRNIPIVYVSDTPHWPCLVRMPNPPQTAWTTAEEVGVYYGHLLCGGSEPNMNVAGTTGFTDDDHSLYAGSIGPPYNCKIINSDQYLLTSSTGITLDPSEIAPINTNGTTPFVPGIRVGHCRSTTPTTMPYLHLVFVSMGTTMRNVPMPSFSTASLGAFSTDIRAFLDDILQELMNSGLMQRT
jgi:hypothetical protein